MPNIEPFEKYSEQYENWFLKNRYAYKAELEAVRKHLPAKSNGIEIGAGSGLFSGPLGIRVGLEPSKKMRLLAAKRGITVIEGVAEKNPIVDEFYDFALLVTTICFVDDADLCIREAKRIIKTGGKLIIGLIDKNSPVGRSYRNHQKENVFYRQANFFSTHEIIKKMKKAGFNNFYTTQTIFKSLDKINATETIEEGHGKGSFVVISAVK